MPRIAALSLSVLAVVGFSLAACGRVYDDPTAMTCARLAHDAHARALMTDAIDNRLHARSMMPLEPLPTPQLITVEVAQRCATSRTPQSDRPYDQALSALGGG